MKDNAEIVQKQESFDEPVFILTLEGENSALNIERHYVKVQEVLASIGGVFKCLFLFAQMINFSYNQLKIKKGFLKKIYSNFVSLNDDRHTGDCSILKEKSGEDIPDEKDYVGEPKLEKDYYSDYSKKNNLIN